MTDRSRTRSESDPNGRDDPELRALMLERRYLINLTYRLLGSLTEAEDAVQETYSRWYAMASDDQAKIISPGAWLTTVATRVSLDMLKSARARREQYVGEWIPEPIPASNEWIRGWSGGTAADPADRVTLDESITMAFLVVLEEMTPAERVVFILHDVFRYPFGDIAEMVGRSPAACRQLAVSARRRVRSAEASGPATRPEQCAATIRNFKRAWENQDVQALIMLLDPDVVATADGGGVIAAEPHPVTGSEQVARSLLKVAGSAPDLTITEKMVNGRPGLLVHQAGQTVAVIAMQVVGDRIGRIWAVRNPDKLCPWFDGAASSGSIQDGTGLRRPHR